jgi:hypothetical protein
MGRSIKGGMWLSFLLPSSLVLYDGGLRASGFYFGLVKCWTRLIYVQGCRSSRTV